MEVKTFWWNKSRRAQSNTDFETWVEGGVAPTMNSFDNGDSRATTIIIMRNREGKPGGGKGPMLGEKSFTLATNNDQVLFEPTTIVFKPHQQDGARIQGDVINTLTAQMGTGGNNVPMVAHPIQGNMIGRSDTAGPEGKGYGDVTDPMFSLTSTDKHAVAFAIDSEGSNSMKSKNPNSGCNEVTIANTITTMTPDPSDYRGGNAIVTNNMPMMAEVLAFDTFNQTVSDKNQTIKSHSANNENIGTVLEKSTVRRLTPKECERLQGFPDDWTVSQSDSARYKQMGNAVAVPVVDWLIKGML